MEPGKACVDSRGHWDIFQICAELNNFVELKPALTSIIKKLKELSDCEAVSIRLYDNGDYPFRAGEQNVLMGASIGISIFPADGENSTDLLKAADAAMYRAKKSGGNVFQFFSNPT